MSEMPTILELMNAPQLLGGHFAGPSWDVWRSVLAAAYRLKMTTRDRRLFSTVSGGRPPPRKAVRELVAVGGRRSGKDSVASLIATHSAACIDHRPHLRPGERALCACFASDREQAKIVLGYVRSYFRENRFLKRMVERATATGLLLNRSTEIAIVTNNWRAPRGRAIALAILDEVGVWKSEESATPDVETYRALRPGLLTLPEARLVLISTPHKRSGLLYTRWQRFFGKPDENTLVEHGSSQTFNPSLSKKFIDEIAADDPVAARAEIYAEWRDDVGAFLDFDWIERAAVLEDGELPPVPGIAYCCFIDPSAGRRDAMTIAIAHRECERVVVDLVRGRKAPFDPASVVREFADVMTRYGCRTATGDRFAGEWVTTAFAQHGKQIVAAARSKSEIYLEAEPLFAQGTIAIPRGRVLLAELRNLERRTVRGGADKVDHPGGDAFHDDHANSCCGAAWLAAAGAQESWLRRVNWARVDATVSRAGNFRPAGITSLEQRRLGI